jgi:hypothetical protein
MKRTLLFITAVLAVLTLFFAACQHPVTNPSSLKSSEEIVAVSGPEWVKATAYRGAIFVSWAFNKDAKTYSVYRQRTDGKDQLTRLVTPNPTYNQAASGYADFYLLDTVSPTNQLVDGVEYTYYVTANSGQGLTGRAVTGPTGGTEPVTVILDGAAKTTVRAKIPARYNDAGVWQDVKALLEADQKLEAASVKEEKVKTGSTDELLLTWPHYNPGFQYTVYYDIGKTLTLNTEIASPDPDPSTALGTYAFYGVPLFGGENTARIVVTLDGDKYYYQPVEITKPLTNYALATLPDVSISNPIYRTATTAQIKWTAIAGAPNYSDYKLYRIETKNVVNFPIAASIDVVGDWTAVAIGASTSLDDDRGIRTITVQDTGLTPSKNYLYVLYAETGTAPNIAKSAPGFGSVSAFTVPAAPILDLETSYVEDVNARRTYSVVVGWNKEDGHASYLLEKAPVTTSPTDSSKTITGAFVTVAANPMADASGRYTVIDKPDLWKAWKYRLTAKDADGVPIYSEKNLSTYPFLDSVNSSISVAASNQTAYANKITIGDPGYKTDVFVDIYRAEVPANSSVSVVDDDFTNHAAEDTAFTRIKENLSLKTDLTYTDENLFIGTKYIYRHVVKVSSNGTAANAVAIANTNGLVIANTGYVKEPSVPRITGVVSDAGKNTTSPIYYFKVPQSTLAATKVQLQRRSATTSNPGADTWSGVATDTLRVVLTATPPAGSSLAQNDCYVQFNEPSAADKGSYEYRLVLVDQEGTVADNSAGANRLRGTSVDTW